MNIIITQWALDSYLDLYHQNHFTKTDYREYIRPDVLLLKEYPYPTQFKQSKFWSIVNEIPDAYKMKWHQVGNGKVQLRLPVGMFNEAYLCMAYIKADPKKEKRMLEKLRTHLQLIRENKFILCGRLV